MDAADKLRKWMSDRAMTQEDFEKKHGISQAAVSAWVKRRKRPGLTMANAVQRITGIKASLWLDVSLEPLPRKEKAA